MAGLNELVWYGARVCLVAMFPFSAMDKNLALEERACASRLRQASRRQADAHCGDCRRVRDTYLHRGRRVRSHRGLCACRLLRGNCLSVPSLLGLLRFLDRERQQPSARALLAIPEELWLGWRVTAYRLRGSSRPGRGGAARAVLV